MYGGIPAGTIKTAPSALAAPALTARSMGELAFFSYASYASYASSPHAEPHKSSGSGRSPIARAAATAGAVSASSPFYWGGAAAGIALALKRASFDPTGPASPTAGKAGPYSDGRHSGMEGPSGKAAAGQTAPPALRRLAACALTLSHLSRCRAVGHGRADGGMNIRLPCILTTSLATALPVWPSIMQLAR